MNSIALTTPATTTPSPPTEAAAVTEPLSDRARFSALMRASHRELLVYARSLTRNHHGAQDFVQDAFVAAFGKFQKKREIGKSWRGVRSARGMPRFDPQGRRAELQQLLRDAMDRFMKKGAKVEDENIYGGTSISVSF